MLVTLLLPKPRFCKIKCAYRSARRWVSIIILPPDLLHTISPGANVGNGESDKRLVGTGYAIIHPTGRLNECDYCSVVSKRLRDWPLVAFRARAHISSR